MNSAEFNYKLTQYSHLLFRLQDKHRDKYRLNNDVGLIIASLGILISYICTISFSWSILALPLAGYFFVKGEIHRRRSNRVLELLKQAHIFQSVETIDAMQAYALERYKI